MIRRILIAFIVCCLTSTASAQTAKPKGPKPEPKTAVLKDDRIVWEYEVVRIVKKTKAVKETTADGKVVEKQVDYLEQVREKKIGGIPAKDARAVRVDGKPVSAADLAKILAVPTRVLIAVDHDKVDPHYLQYYRPEVVIIHPPKSDPNVPGV